MIYLLGGVSGFTGALKSSLQINLKDAESIVFLPTSPENMDKTKYYAEKTISLFSNIGLKFNDVKILSLAMLVEEMHLIIQSSDVVYLMGGKPESQMTFIKSNNLESTLRTAPILIGNSAGAINLCETAFVSKDDQYPESLIYKGLNIATNIIVEVHYTKTSDDRIIEAMKYYNMKNIIAIPEEMGILIDEDIKYLGEDIKIFN